MTETTPARPTPEHVRLQLERMLDCDRFQNAPIQSALLEFVTKRANAGKLSTEDQIGRALFPGFIKEESGDVRQAARNLRKTLENYYESEGSSDLVSIRLPTPPKDKKVKLKEGQAYTPIFRYNRHNETQKRYELSAFLKANASRFDPTLSENLLKVLNSHSDHVDAILTFAQLHFDPYVFEEKADGEYGSMLRDVTILVDKALGLAPQYWRAHVVKAHFFAHSSPEQAELWFSKARALDKKATDTSREYIQHLVRMWRFDEMIAILRPHLETRFEDQRLYAYLALALLAVGRDTEAESTLKLALQLDSTNFPVLLMMARFCFERKRHQEASEYLNRLRFLVEPEDFERLTRHL